ERESDVVPPLVVSQIVEIAHLVAYILRDRGVQLRFQVRELVLDRISLALGEKWRTVELPQLLLGQTPHETRHIYLPSALARPTLETVGIEKAHEQLEVGVITVVRRRGHEHEVSRPAAGKLPKLVTLCVFHLGAEQARSHAMSFVADDEV